LAPGVPREEVPEGYVYYPAAGFDDAPVKHLRRHFWSVVYVDSGRTERDRERTLIEAPFRGDVLIVDRRLGPSNLTSCGWATRQHSDTGA
jgi:hypothetical protein